MAVVQALSEWRRIQLSSSEDGRKQTLAWIGCPYHDSNY